MTKEIDMDAVVDELHRRGVHAYVEQTGGGCATIYAGPQHEEPDWGPRWAALAGPGWFSGPGWTLPRALLGDFYVGADDDGESEAWTTSEDDTPLTVADKICEQIDHYKAEQELTDHPKATRRHGA